LKTVAKLSSIQARLLAMMLGLATLVWLSAALLTWIDVSHELDELLDGHLSQAAALLVVQAHHDEDDDDDDIRDVPISHKYAPQVAFQVFINDLLITRSTNVGTAPIASSETGFSTIKMNNGETWRVFVTPENERKVRVFVGEKVDSRHAIVWAVLRSMLWPLAIALPVLAFVGWWSVRWGLAPLRELSMTLAKRAPQALEPVTLQDMPQEMQPLVGALNALFQRIDGMVASERRFTADAAHELRTPIAAIRAQAQVALGAGDDSAQRSHALQSTLAGCDRATRLMDQLLTLARLEASQAKPAAQVDLVTLARRVSADLAPTALARGQSLELDAHGACAVAADEVLLGVLVRNLVDNALRYSPPGARVVVSVQPGPKGTDGCELCVQDSGPGMSSESMQRLGERFFRVLGSDQPGSGLGWSIVRRIADVFGAQLVACRSPALGGLMVTVRLPH
jgi:two-component system, OmpR family, sensor histidine kinase QseC